MTEDILISVRGLHTLDIEQEEEETDELEMTMPGKYYFRNGKHYVLFEETDEESQSVVKNRFKLSEDRLEISKKGAMNTTMTFQNFSCRQVTLYFNWHSFSPVLSFLH